MDGPAGEVVGGWRVLARLGAGAGGTVDLAESTDGLGKRVALKRFARDAARHRERELLAYRKIEEIRRATGTPHLVEGLAAGTLPDGTGFIALAYQEGGTLAERVRRDGPLPAREAAAIVGGALEAIALLHEAGLCHRDVKPGNVLLGSDGRARLGDFGLATPRNAAISSGGTPAFAAPEQWSTLDADEEGEADGARGGVAIDIYGAGATLYHALTGRPPLPGRPDIFALEKRRVPRPLQDVVLRALEERPEDRFASAREMAAALAAAVAGANAEPGPARAATLRRMRPLRAIVALVLMGGVLYAIDRTAAPVDRSPRAPGTVVPGHDEGRGPYVVYGREGESRRLDLPAPLVCQCALPDGRVAVGLADGEVLLLDPAGGDPPRRELARFARTVLSIGLAGARLIARGDDRLPVALAPGEEPPPGAIAVEGAAGRYAFPRDPVVREVAIDVPARAAP